MNKKTAYDKKKNRAQRLLELLLSQAQVRRASPDEKARLCLQEGLILEDQEYRAGLAYRKAMARFLHLDYASLEERGRTLCCQKLHKTEMAQIERAKRAIWYKSQDPGDPACVCYTNYFPLDIPPSRVSKELCSVDEVSIASWLENLESRIADQSWTNFELFEALFEELQKDYQAKLPPRLLIKRIRYLHCRSLRNSFVYESQKVMDASSSFKNSYSSSLSCAEWKLPSVRFSTHIVFLGSEKALKAIFKALAKDGSIPDWYAELFEEEILGHFLVKTDKSRYARPKEGYNPIEWSKSEPELVGFLFSLYALGLMDERDRTHYAAIAAYHFKMEKKNGEENGEIHAHTLSQIVYSALETTSLEKAQKKYEALVCRAIRKHKRPK